MATRRTDRPNVLVFFTDQQRWDSAGVHGNPLELTPNFDRIATRGTHLANTFTCQPVCGPARSCLQTGQHATNTGVWRNGLALRPGDKTLANWFAEAGYDTGYIGKWHLASANAVPVEQQGGYDYWLGANVLEACSEPYRCEMFDKQGNTVRLPGYRVDAEADATIRYIEAHKDNPFFLFTSYLEPHFQNHVDDYPAPDGYRERYTGRWTPPDLAALGGSTHQHLGGYWGICKRLDEAFGRVLDALKSLDMLDNTIVLFTSDHACHFKTRNGEYKRSCHDSSIRVPTAICGPGFEGGGQVRQPVSLLDIPPTLLNAAGIPVPDSMEGHSVVPLLRGHTDGWQEEVFIQISEAQVGRAIRTDRWTYSVRAPEDHEGGGAASDHYVEEFLYDNHFDPHQLYNRIGIESHADVTADLRRRLVRRMAEAGEPEPTIEPAAPVRSGQRRVTLFPDG